MLEKLKQRWKVNNTSLFLIICTFAIGGSLCGYLGRKILELLGLEKDALWVAAYIVLLTITWPLCVLLVSIPFRQFSFFSNYLYKIWSWITGNKANPVHIAIFASGAGSNAQKIINRFRGSQCVTISLIVCNKEGAGILSIAAKEGIPSLLIDKNSFFKEGACVKELREYRISFIVLAGFLWKIPSVLINAYPNKIVNIHPALLPKYGGKGMYGNRVHEAVIAAKEKQSGISIHYVDEIYDHGKIIFQAACPVDEKDNAATLAQKIHALEHKHYPEVIEDLLQIQNRR
jgi:formyltetrahydrofolate-dependent phosphoribosylglycinamide formyltransferase